MFMTLVKMIWKKSVNGGEFNKFLKKINNGN